MAFFSLFSNAKGIDFNYPQDVSKAASADLNAALKSGDGQLAVDALVRFSIAQSGISDDNLPVIISRIDSTIKLERRPAYKALLRYFEAVVFDQYMNHAGVFGRTASPDVENPEDYSEWAPVQFRAKIEELVKSSVSDAASLKAVKVTDLDKILTYDDMGVTYVPTLYQFLLMKGIELLPYSSTSAQLANDWIASVEGDVPATIYANVKNYPSKSAEIYNRYIDNEHSALALEHMSSSDIYKRLQDYVARFPDGYYTPKVKNRIINMEEKHVSLYYPDYVNSNTRFDISTNTTNVNHYSVNIYRIPDKLLKAYSYKIQELELVQTIDANVQGTIPFNGSATVECKGLPYGVYVMTASYDAQGEKVFEKDITNYSKMRVSDIALFTIEKGSHTGLFAVNSKTGAPMPGVTITGEKEKFSGVTNANGEVKLPDTNHGTEYSATCGNDRYAESLYTYNYYSSGSTRKAVSIFTDLGIYRPGETVNWALIAYSSGNGSRALAPNEKLSVILYDTNRQPIDTVTVTTDEFGRADGTFKIPTDRLNGNFSMEVNGGKNNDRFWAYASIDVSEYKTPTFDVAFDKKRIAFNTGDPVKIEGNAETYSGMPVGGTEVKLKVKRCEWTWMWRYANREDQGTVVCDTTVTTDATGKFSLELPSSLFPENINKYRWCRYSYSVHATVTNAAGETQEADHSFIIGVRRGIEMAGDITHVNTKPLDVPITYNTTSETEKSVVCTYELIPKGSEVPVSTGNFNTANPVIDLTRIPSGEYTLKAHILGADKDEEDVDAKADVILYRVNDKTSPVADCPMWIPETYVDADANGNAVITVGTSTPEAHIYYLVDSHKGIEREGWQDYKPGMHQFKVQVPLRDEEQLTVKMITYYDGKFYSKNISVSCKELRQELRLKATSFRDLMVPGKPERWSFSVTDKNGKPRNAAMMLEMFDKALNTLSDNAWHFYVDWGWRSHYNLRQQSLTGTNSTSVSWQAKTFSTSSATLPELYLYDQTIFGRMRYARLKMSAGAAMVEACPVSESAPDDALVEAKAAPEVARGVQANAAAKMEEKEEKATLDNVAVRMSDVKTALWRPMLTTDKDGNVVVEFDAPQFNTTWIVQALAYGKDLYTDRFSRETLTQKHIMVRSSVPRFVRSGDKVRLTASVMNSTEEAVKADAVIELFDPRSGDLYASQKYSENIGPKGTNAVAIDWNVPDSLAFVGFRIKAAAGDYADGEQVMVPVLANVQPVIETKPFYIEPTENSFSLTLPQAARDARVTLEYCDNPVWYCVTALPTIFDENYTISSILAHNLFSIDVAQGVVRDMPQIRDAVKHWKANPQDSVLVSMLAKNQDLKIGTLLASPWIRESERQTLRMSQLDRLMDPDAMKQERQKIVEALLSLQMADGGWCWYKYPGAISSLYTTHEVLELIGEIKHLGYLPADASLDKAVKRALDYFDRKWVEEYNRSDNKKDFDRYSSLAYVRTLFKEVPMRKDTQKLFNNTIKDMEKNWRKGLSLSSKAYFALTLERNGKHRTAQDITESIRQFSITKPELGTYWDNLQSGWRYFDKVAVTSTILQALKEVDNRTAEIDGVRKWILLMKQTNDWGSGSLAADAVYSILTTGTDWLKPAGEVNITIGGKSLDLTDSERYLGYIRRTVSADAGSTVAITRQGGSPAWGAVYNQFTATMQQVEKVAIDEISVDKQYYVYGKDNKLVPATTLKVGDKVQVRMVIKNNRDLDFVTVEDERASCFEPVDHFSGYRYDDYLYYYLETKDMRTNVFFTSLPKGTHVITYDVFVSAAGEFSAGIASAQCQYAPQIAAHSAGTTIKAVK